MFGCPFLSAYKLQIPKQYCFGELNSTNPYWTKIATLEIDES